MSSNVSTNHRSLIMHRSMIRLSLVAVLILVLSGCSLKSQNTETFDEMAYPELHNGPEMTSSQYERMGDDLYERQSPEMAYVQYTRAIATVGTDKQREATLQVKKGLVIFSQGHDEAALKEFQQVLGQFPDHPLANEAAGAVYLKAGLSQEARAHFEKAAALDPSLWRTQQYLGMLASRESRYEDAVRYFSVSLELRPGQPGTLNNLGVAHLMSGNYEPALSAFRQALAAGAPQAKTYNNIGLTLARMGRTQEALQTFRFGGSDAKAHNNLGYVLMLQGDNELAIHHFQRAIELSPSYYAKAFSNLKQAQLAHSFTQSVPTVPSPEAQSMLPQPSSTPQIAPQPAQAEPGLPIMQDQPSPVSALGYVPFQKTSVTGPGLSLTTPVVTSSPLPQEAPAPVNVTNLADYEGKYGLHVASFRNPKRTAIYVRQLEDKGIQSMVMSVVIDGRTWQRVLAGRFDSTSAAAAARPALLTQLGLDNAPIKQFTGPGSSLPPQADGNRSL